MTREERIETITSSPYAVGQESLALQLAERLPDEMPLDVVFEALAITQNSRAQFRAATQAALELLQAHISLHVIH